MALNQNLARRNSSFFKYERPLMDHLTRHVTISLKKKSHIWEIGDGFTI